MTDRDWATPKEAILVDADGLPIGFVNFDEISSMATRLMYAMAANCGDSDALDAVAVRYLREAGNDSFGYVCAAALSSTMRNILEPTLQTVEALSPELGAQLRKALVDGRAQADEALKPTQG